MSGSAKKSLILLAISTTGPRGSDSTWMCWELLLQHVRTSLAKWLRPSGPWVAGQPTQRAEQRPHICPRANTRTLCGHGLAGSERGRGSGAPGSARHHHKNPYEWETAAEEAASVMLCGLLGRRREGPCRGTRAPAQSCKETARTWILLGAPGGECSSLGCGTVRGSVSTGGSRPGGGLRTHFPGLRGQVPQSGGV